MQPTHQTSDRLMAEEAARPEPARRRLCLADRAEERRAAGVRHRLPGRNRPTPSPASPPAISRQDMNGQPPGGWIPPERLTLRAGARRLTPAARPMPGSPRTRSARSSPANGPTSSSSTAIRPRSTRRRLRARRCWKPGSAGRRSGERARLALRRRAREVSIAGVSTCGSSSGWLARRIPQVEAARRRGRGFRGSA